MKDNQPNAVEPSKERGEQETLVPRGPNTTGYENATPARPSYGNVEISQNDLTPLLGPDGRPIVGTKYVWRPSPALANQLPADFGFAMRCVVNPDGLRRFYRHFDAMISEAFVGGLSILSAVRNLTLEQRFSYMASYHLFQRLLDRKQHLTNNLLFIGSLGISASGRQLEDERSILPVTLGLDARGQGAAWSVRRLVDEGRALALEAGIAAPSPKDCIHYGFVAAARFNPLYLAPAQVQPILQQALYESIPISEPLSPELVEEITARILEAIQEHLFEPAERFNAWFSGPKNSFARQIANRKLRPFGVVDVKIVNCVLQDLGWRGYEYVSACINEQMRVFLRLLPDPLNETEMEWFRQMHLAQPHFGGFPLALLHERYPFLRSMIWEIMANPGNAESIAVMHRMLYFFGEMASKRREVDRLVQQRRDGFQASGRRSLTVPLATGTAAHDENDGDDDDAKPNERFGNQSIDDNDVDTQRSEASDDEPNDDNHERDEESGNGSSSPTSEGRYASIFNVVAQGIREEQRIQCNCPAPEWIAKATSKPDADPIVINHGCEKCDFNIDTRIARDAFKARAQTLMNRRS